MPASRSAPLSPSDAGRLRPWRRDRQPDPAARAVQDTGTVGSNAGSSKSRRSGGSSKSEEEAMVAGSTFGLLRRVADGLTPYKARNCREKGAQSAKPVSSAIIVIDRS